MTAVAEAADLYRAAFERVAGAGRPGPEWLGRRRRESFERFAARGFPTPALEEWRFTSVAALARTAFRAVEARDTASVPGGSWVELGGPQAVFVDGRLAPALSSLGGVPGLDVRGLGEVLAEAPGRLEASWGGAGREERSVFTALNTALVEDGALVELAPGAVVERPLHLVFVSTGGAGGDPVASHPRTVVRAGAGSRLAVVESYLGPPSATYFTNAVTEVVLEADATVERYKLQHEGAAAHHVSGLDVVQARGSRFSDVSLCLGGRLARNDLEVRLAGEGGECSLLGLFMAGGEQHMDTHSWIDHAAPHCSSREVYRGILDGRARGVFHGTVQVRAGAQKTDAYQVNKNLLLSAEAVVNSTPALEILADDVKCKHGSTTGQLDPGSLFYLRSRGLGEVQARSLLVYAFAAEVVGRIRVPALRSAVESFLRDRLPGAPREEVSA